MVETVKIEKAPQRLNFANHLAQLNAKRGEKIAYIDDSGTLSYGDLTASARRFGGALLRLGLKREQRVMLVMQDNREWPICFLGCLHAGIVPVAVNTLLSASDYAWMLQNSGAQAVFTSPALLDCLKKAASDAKLETLPIYVAGSAGETPTVSSLVKDGPDIPATDTACDDIAFWLYSSGSTGKPKGTVHTHGNLFATNATYGQHVLGLTEDDVTFSAAKLFFAYGLGNSLTFPLCAGATVILMAERPTPDAVFKRLTEQKPTVFFGVPTLYASMLASPQAPEREQLGLHLCASAGEALPKDLGERFTARYGAPILDGIGSTEMLHIFISNVRGEVRYGTSGRPVPGYEVKLVGENGQVVGVGEIGDLYVRGDSQALMYWCNREKSRATFLGDWMKTGDKYEVTADGHYVYSGRSDDMLKISGQYVSPFEVESALIQHKAVLEAALIGVNDTDGLVKGKAFVILKAGNSGSDTLASELRTYLKEKLTPHKVPKSIEFVAELPKTPTGKIQRFRLREREARPA